MKFLKLAPRKPPKWLVDRFGPRLLRVERQIGARLLRRGQDVAPPLACGSYGCVFQVEGDETRVVKVTEDRHEGAYTAYIMALQQAGARTEEGLVIAVTVRIDGVWHLEESEDDDEDEDEPVFVILEERVLPSKECKISKKIQSAADTYTDGWDLVMQASEEDSTKRAAKKYAEAKTLIADGLRGLRRAGDEGRKVAALLDLVHEEQFPLTDMHRDNLCRRIYKGPNGAEPGQIVIIDFGVSEAGSPFGRSVKRIGSEDLVGDSASDRRSARS
jgi:hypothetical protein